VEWTGARYADKPTVEVETFAAASPERVWDVFSDIDLMVELSDELQRVEWCDGATGPSAGARFVGYNKHEAFGEWETISTVVECQRPRVFAWAIGDPDHPGAVWRFSAEPSGEGTTLRQWVQMGPARSGLSVAIDRMPDKEQKIVFVRLREYEAGMTANLAAIKARVEGRAELGEA
jgi:Polyketide cyclase / dehydrase and lipid transport